MKKSKISLNGFTLIELVIVIGIIAIAGASTAAASRGIQRRTLQNASLAIQADMRRAQRMALMEGRRWRVQFEERYNRYSIGPIPRDPNRLYIMYLPRGVYFEYLPRSSVDYLPRGTLGGTGFGTGTGFTMDLRSGRYMQRMTILPVTGRVTVFDIETLTGG